MTTELSFLIELLLNHKLQKSTKDAVAARIKDVEANYQPQRQTQPAALPANAGQQAPSTMALLAKHPDLAAAQPVVNVAQNAITAAALADRQNMINKAASSKPLAAREEGRTSPRKF